MLAVVLVVGVFILSFGALFIVGSAVTVATDIIATESLPTPVKAGLALLLAGISAIVVSATASGHGLVFDTALLNQFVTIVVGTVVTYLGATKPLGLSGAVQAHVNVPLVTPAVAAVVTGVSKLSLPTRGPSKKDLEAQLAALQPPTAPVEPAATTPPAV